jgi:hypothetical protein
MEPYTPSKQPDFTWQYTADVVSEIASFTKGIDKGSPTSRFVQETAKAGDSNVSNTNNFLTINFLEEQ